MDVARRETTLLTVKMPPEVSGQGVNLGSTQIDVAGTTCGSSQLRQEGHNIPDRVEYMATDHNIRLEIIRGILPGGLHIRDVGELLFTRISAQVVEHGSIRFDGDNVLRLRCESHAKTPGTRTNI